MSAAGSDSDAETVITEGMIERGKERTEKETQGKVSQITEELEESHAHARHLSHTTHAVKNQVLLP
jgi:hypothetical protein